MTTDFSDPTGGRLETLALWSRPEPGTRRPRWSRDDIAATAMRIADEEGFEALTMRRVAAELEAGTMSLYHYVRTKDEMLTLVVDAFMGEVVVPADELPDEWRAAMTVIARRTRDALARHPWVLTVQDDPLFGPNGLRHFDQCLRAVRSLDLSIEEKMEIVMAVDDLVFGYCFQLRNNAPAPDTAADELIGYVAELASQGDHPEIARLLAEAPIATTWRRIESAMADPDRFERALARLLDGIELDLARRAGAG